MLARTALHMSAHVDKRFDRIRGSGAGFQQWLDEVELGSSMTATTAMLCWGCPMLCCFWRPPARHLLLSSAVMQMVRGHDEEQGSCGMLKAVQNSSYSSIACWGRACAVHNDGVLTPCAAGAGEIMDQGRAEMQRRWRELQRIEALSPRFRFQASPRTAA